MTTAIQANTTSMPSMRLGFMRTLSAVEPALASGTPLCPASIGRERRMRLQHRHDGCLAVAHQVAKTVAALRAVIAKADGVFFVTPEYNSSISGVLKNALDWVSRPIATNTIRNKPVAVIGASSGGFGAVWSQAELRKVLGAMGARVVDGEVAVGHAMDRFDSLGRLNDANLEEQVREVGRQLLVEAGATTRHTVAA